MVVIDDERAICDVTYARSGKCNIYPGRCHQGSDPRASASQAYMFVEVSLQRTAVTALYFSLGRRRLPLNSKLGFLPLQQCPKHACNLMHNVFKAADSSFNS